jgi:hypothetical protein
MAKKNSSKTKSGEEDRVPLEMDEIEERLIELLKVEKKDYEERCRTPQVNPFTREPVKKGQPGYPIDPFPCGTTDKKLDEFSKQTGVQIPASLRRWLKLTNGAAGFYGVDSSTGKDIEKIWEWFPDWKTRSWIPVAIDANGNYYVQPACDAVCYVESLNPDELSYVVASDMLHFALFAFEDQMELHRPLARSKGYDIYLPKSSMRRGVPPTELNPWPFSKKYMMFRDPELKNIKELPTAWR